jgi:hypothetical protein
MKKIVKEFGREVKEVVESARRSGRAEEVFPGDIDPLLSPAELTDLLAELDELNQ